jgi:hypothetical protein
MRKMKTNRSKMPFPPNNCPTLEMPVLFAWTRSKMMMTSAVYNAVTPSMRLASILG